MNTSKPIKRWANRYILPTAEQQQILDSKASAIIISALAGTGKTTTLCMKACHLLEQLGSDEGRGGFQTPLATLFAFNGWADLFLRTPDAGLTDTFARAGKSFEVKGLGKIDLLAVYHRFDSDFGSRHYGDEIDLSAGLAVGRASFLARFASYRADGFAADTRKFWLQTDIAF